MRTSGGTPGLHLTALFSSVGSADLTAQFFAIVLSASAFDLSLPAAFTPRHTMVTTAAMFFDMNIRLGTTDVTLESLGWSTAFCAS